MEQTHRGIQEVAYAEGVEKRMLIDPQQGAPSFVSRVFDLGPGKTSAYQIRDWGRILCAGQPR